MTQIGGKRILFIGIGFYDYETCIVERLRELGAVVDMHVDRPRSLRTGMLAALYRRLGCRGDRLILRHEAAILRSHGDGYDYVIVIKGVGLRVEFLRELRARNTQAQFILYLWDSIARLSGIERRVEYFERVLTFDRRDASENPAFTFRPLFYREEAEQQEPDSKSLIGFGVSFVGWLHADRLRSVRRVQARAEAQDIAIFVYLYTGLYTWIKLALSGNARNVHFRPMPYAAVMAVNRRSSAILDLPHSEQSGMTMRAIEAIGMGKRLITTARDAQNYDFASASRVAIIDASNPEIDPSFLTGAVSPLAPGLRMRYSLNAWISDVLSVGPPG